MTPPSELTTARLRHQLTDEARSVFARINAAFTQRTGLAAERLQWHANERCHSSHIAAWERRSAQAIPEDAAACYRAGTGVLETCGWYWWPFSELTAKNRELSRTAEKAGLALPSAGAATAGDSADGCVQAVAWHPGWVAVAERLHTPGRGTSYLCLDMAPGSQGSWGQLIEVPSPRLPKTALERPEVRRVAGGLLAYWQRLAEVLASAPACAEWDQWAAAPRERTLRVELVPHSGEGQSASPVLKELQIRQARSLVARTAEVAGGPTFDLRAVLLRDTPAPAVAADPLLIRREFDVQAAYVPNADNYEVVGSDKAEGPGDATEWLSSWKASSRTALCLLVGWAGDGKSTLLQALAADMALQARKSASKPVPFYIDLAPLCDHQAGTAPLLLEDAIASTLRHRGVADVGSALVAAVLQSVSDGGCTLILDHMEAVAPYLSEVTEWADQLPLASEGLSRRKARVLWSICTEYFDQHIPLADAAQAMALARLDKQERAYVLRLQDIEDDVSLAHLRGAGVDLTASLDLGAIWQELGHRRALPGKLAAWRASAAEAASSRSRGEAFARAWWRRCVPADLNLDGEALADFAAHIGRAEALTRFNADVVAAAFDDLVQQLEPQANDALRRRLRMALRVALQAGNELNRHQMGCVQWCGRQMVSQLEKGDIAGVVENWVPSTMAGAVARSAADAWMAAGHEQVPACLPESVQASRSPVETGMSFVLLVAMVNQYAWRAMQRPGQGGGLIFQLKRGLERVFAVPLSELRLTGADLRGIELEHFHLHDLDFSHTRLEGANFRCAQLADMQMVGARLDGANFKEAKLERVNLNQASANRADFGAAVFVDVSGDGLVAQGSNWLNAKWNRRWPTADLGHAVLSVRGVSPSSADSDFCFDVRPGRASGLIYGLARSNDGVGIAAFGEGNISVWPAATPELGWHVRLPEGPLGQVTALCFSGDGRVLFTAHGDASISAWSVSHGGRLHQLSREGRRPVRQLLVSHDGEVLVGLTGSGDWSLTDKNLVPFSRLPMDVAIWLTGGEPKVLAMARRAPGAYLWCTTRALPYDPAPCLFSRVPGMPPVRKSAWTSSQVWRMALAWDDGLAQEWLALLTEEGIVIGHADADEPMWRIPRPGAVVHSDAYMAADAKWTEQCSRMAGPRPRPGWVMPPNPQQDDPDAQVADIAISPDARWLVCVGDGHPALAVHLQTGTVHELSPAHSQDAWACVFHADGTLLLACDQLQACPLPDVHMVPA